MLWEHLHMWGDFEVGKLRCCTHCLVKGHSPYGRRSKLNLTSRRDGARQHTRPGWIRSVN